jgi:hypothetical protein
MEETTAAVRRAIEHFLDRVDHADAAALSGCLCADATAWLPFRSTPGLIRGAQSIRARFERLFADLAARNPNGPPYVRFRIDSFETVPLDPQTVLAIAAVSFGHEFGRRSFVLRREGVDWRLLHIHASNIRQDSG